MIRAIPLVNPIISGWGIYLIMAHRRASPKMINIIPARKVAVISPFAPCI
jgi:hypothetical protein